MLQKRISRRRTGRRRKQRGSWTSRMLRRTKHHAAEKDLEKAHRAKEEAKRELDKQNAEKEEAHAAVQKEEEHVKEAEKDLEDSRERLRRMRGMEAVPGATPEPPKAGAARISMSFTLVVVLVAALAT